MSSYHGRIMNLQIDPENALDGWTEGELRAYKYGHRDARHTAAVLGNDADIELHTARARAAAAAARIAELEAALAQDPPASAALARARADYLAWHPAPATVTSGDSGGSASGGEGE